MVDVLLRAEKVVRRYGPRTVLAIDDLSVLDGEVLAIVGPNGAGKSTLFRVLLQVEKPDEGTVHVRGSRAAVTGVFQRPILFTGTVRDNIAFGLKARGVRGAESEARVGEALAWLGLEALASANVHRLSGGEAQRVALARALVTRPDVLLLDEPTASLDASIRRRFRDDLEGVARRRARSIVIITHDLSEAFGLADRVAVLHEGRIVQLATPDEIILYPGSPFVAELTGAELMLHGQVEAVDDGLVLVKVAPEIRLWAAAGGLPAGTAVVVAYRPEDVVIAAGAAPADTSAVNRIAATVETLVPAGALVRVRLRAESATLTALLTRRSVETLGLSPGVPVTAQLKAAALHAWRREPHHTT